jgi:hypothetical protein
LPGVLVVDTLSEGAVAVRSDLERILEWSSLTGGDGLRKKAARFITPSRGKPSGTWVIGLKGTSETSASAPLFGRPPAMPAQAPVDHHARCSRPPPSEAQLV